MGTQPIDINEVDRCKVAVLDLQRVDETEQTDINAAWDGTVTRRLDELTSGVVTPVSGRETRAVAWAQLANRR